MSFFRIEPFLHGELYRYWASVRGEQAVPSRSDVDPLGMVRLLPFIGLIERRAEGYFWRLIGTAIVEHFGRDPTGTQYGAGFSPTAFVAATTATFDAALEQQVPFFDEFIYRSAKGFPHAVSRLVCPLTGSSRHPPMVIHTRVHYYCSEGLPVSSLREEAWGELRNRWPVSSVEEVERRAAVWFAKASAPAPV